MSIVREAYDNFLLGNVETASSLYTKAEQTLGVGLFDANIYINNRNFDKTLKNVTAIIKTFERVECLYRLLDSIELFYPSLKVIIVDDSRLPLADFNFNSCDYHWIGFDKGLSYGRNYALEKVNTEYFLLLDDDFVFSSDTNLNAFLEVLVRSDFDIIGGLVKEGDAYMNYYSNISIANGRLVQHPVTRSSSLLTRCEVVLNFFLAKTSSVKSIGGWDTQLKLAEHTDFFINAKDHSLKVGFTEKCTVLHEPKREGSYIDFRTRGKWFTELMMYKRNLKEIINVHGTCYSAKGVGKLELKNNSKMLYHNENVADSHLRIALEISKKLRVKLFLSNGTLLGCVRESGYIGHDTDIDLGIFAYDYRSNLLDEFLKSGFSVFSTHGQPNDGCELSLIKDNIKLDIFFYYPEPNEMLSMSVWDGDKQIKYLYRKFSLKSAIFRGLDVYIPETACNYLEDQYGKDWRTPNVNWDWASSPHNIKKNKG